MAPGAVPSRWEPDPLPPRRHDPEQSRSWFWRVVYILYSLEVGTLLLFLPWLGIWENNYLLYRFPEFRPVVASPFLKGGVVGLGLVNLGIGVHEIAQLWRRRSGPLRPGTP